MILTEFICTILGLVLSLMWIPFNITKQKNFSFDTFYTVHATRCSDSSSDAESTIAQVAVSLVFIIEMVIAVIILNVAHYKIRLHADQGTTGVDT